MVITTRENGRLVKKKALVITNGKMVITMMAIGKRILAREQGLPASEVYFMKENSIWVSNMVLVKKMTKMATQSKEFGKMMD